MTFGVETHECLQDRLALKVKQTTGGAVEGTQVISGKLHSIIINIRTFTLRINLNCFWQRAREVSLVSTENSFHVFRGLVLQGTYI